MGVLNYVSEWPERNLSLKVYPLLVGYLRVPQRGTFMEKLRVVVAGHKPDHLGGFSEEAQGKVHHFALRTLKRHMGQIEIVYTGMSQGWEMAIAEACIELGIPFIAVLPFEAQEAKWPEVVQIRYRDLLKHAKEVVVVSPGEFTSEKVKRRNAWMVDRANLILSLWDRDTSGKSHIIRDANFKSVPVSNLWRRWLRFQGNPAAQKV